MHICLANSLQYGMLESIHIDGTTETPYFVCLVCRLVKPSWLLMHILMVILMHILMVILMDILINASRTLLSVPYYIIFICKNSRAYDPSSNIPHLSTPSLPRRRLNTNRTALRRRRERLRGKPRKRRHCMNSRNAHANRNRYVCLRMSTYASIDMH
jgi:hypothetical protein